MAFLTISMVRSQAFVMVCCTSCAHEGTGAAGFDLLMLWAVIFYQHLLLPTLFLWRRGLCVEVWCMGAKFKHAKRFRVEGGDKSRVVSCSKPSFLLSSSYLFCWRLARWGVGEALKPVSRCLCVFWVSVSRRALGAAWVALKRFTVQAPKGKKRRRKVLTATPGFCFTQTQTPPRKQ